MQARPGRIVDDSMVPFARPRTIEMSFEPEFVSLTQRLRERIVGRARHPGDRVMNEPSRRRILSMTCILGFFVVWELLCLAFHVSDIVLPRPSQILITLWTRFPAIWPHALQTLYTTLVGFAPRASSSAFCSAC